MNRKAKFVFKTFFKHDFKASITVFFVALPLCLGVALASGAPVVSGIIAGIVGGLIVTLVSGSSLSVSGPAAGLTAICTAAITDLGALDIFFVSVSAAGVIQILLGVLKLGGFTHFIPSAVIKGMLAAIGIILMTKQIPLILGYEKPDFYTDEFFNVFTLHSGFDHKEGFFPHISEGTILLSILAIFVIFIWDRFLAKRISFLSSSFVVVIIISALAQWIPDNWHFLALKNSHFVTLPNNIFADIKFPNFKQALGNGMVWKYSLIIAFVASLESLLSLEAVDKLDPMKRVTPPNRELIAQGSGNFISGLFGGIPITSVIVRSSANASAGAKTKWSAFTHGVWLLLAVLFAIPFIQLIPYCVLAIILFLTGYKLTKPSMYKAIFSQGREQFLPFAVTIIAILSTDLLIGVVIGTIYAIYFLIKHTYRAGYTYSEAKHGNILHIQITFALNVSFLNKKRIRNTLDKIPPYSVVTLEATDSVYIDYDILEITQDFKVKAKEKHIELIFIDVPDVKVLDYH